MMRHACVALPATVVSDGSLAVGQDGMPDVIDPGAPLVANPADIEARGIVEFDTVHAP